VTLFGVKFDERFNTLIGLGFVIVVLVAPHGLVGLASRGWTAGRRRFSPGGALVEEAVVAVPAGNAMETVPAPPVDPIEQQDPDSMGISR
jgi:hypothetical protein